MRNNNTGACTCGRSLFHRTHCPVFVEGAVASIVGLSLLWIIMIIYWNVNDGSTAQYVSLGLLTVVTLGTTIPFLLFRTRK